MTEENATILIAEFIKASMQLKIADCQCEGNKIIIHIFSNENNFEIESFSLTVAKE